LNGGEFVKRRHHKLYGTVRILPLPILPLLPSLLLPLPLLPFLLLPLGVDLLLYLLNLLLKRLFLKVTAAFRKREGSFATASGMVLGLGDGVMEVNESVEIFDLFEEFLVLLAAWGGGYVMEMKKDSSWSVSLPLSSS
jgi:hypothetical protein